MDQGLHGQLAMMTNEIREAAIPDDCKQTVLWCFGQLPTLYDQFSQDYESRFSEKITRFIQAMLKELVEVKKPCLKAEQLAANIPEHFRLLHEQWGLPGLTLKAPRKPSTPHSRKAEKHR